MEIFTVIWVRVKYASPVVVVVVVVVMIIIIIIMKFAVIPEAAYFSILHYTI
jgi:hypothetical protein